MSVCPSPGNLKGFKMSLNNQIQNEISSLEKQILSKMQEIETFEKRLSVLKEFQNALQDATLQHIPDPFPKINRRKQGKTTLKDLLLTYLKENGAQPHRKIKQYFAMLGYSKHSAGPIIFQLHADSKILKRGDFWDLRREI